MSIFNRKLKEQITKLNEELDNKDLELSNISSQLVDVQTQLNDTQTQLNEIHKEQEESVCDLINKKLGFAFKKYAISSYKNTEISTVFEAIEKISNGIAKMPWLIKSYDGSEVSDDLYLNHLFDNCIQTRFIFIKNLVHDVLIYGNAYAYIKRDKQGVPVNLIYLAPGQCSLQQALYESKGEILYNVTSQFINGYVEPCDIIHLIMMSENGVNGFSIVNFANKSINLSKYTEKAATDYYGNRLRMTGFISTDAPKLNAKQRKDIKDAYTEGMDSDGISVLEGGMKFNPISNNAKDSSLIEARLYNVQEIARYFSMMPTELGDLSHSSYSTLEQSQTDFVVNTLEAYVISLEEEINRKLVLPKDKSKYYIDLDEDIIIKSDRQSYANYLSSLVKGGIITINEARELLGYHPVSGGDKNIIPFTDVNQNDISNKNNAETDKNINQEDEKQ